MGGVGSIKKKIACVSATVIDESCDEYYGDSVATERAVSFLEQMHPWQS